MLKLFHKILADIKPYNFSQIRICSTQTKPPDLEKRQEELMKKGLPKRKPIDGVKNIILICSGKGGVGKSTVSVNIATALKLKFPSKGVGILDTDISGPSIPLMMNLREKPYVTEDKKLSPLMNYGVKCMSVGFLVDKDVPIVWRGLKVMQGLATLMRQVPWGEIEYLIVDTPPGTGDTILSLLQNLPVAGVILVTTPQSASLEVTRRGAGLFKILNVPIIGLVENMSYVKCSCCSNKIHVFGTGTEKLAEELECDMLASFPLDIAVSHSTDNGTPITVNDISCDTSLQYQEIALKVCDFLDLKNDTDDLDDADRKTIDIP